MDPLHDPNEDRNAPNPFDIPAELVNEEIKKASQKLWDLPFKEGDHNPGIPLTTARVSRLLVLLSRQADLGTAANLRIQRNLIRLTVALFFISLAQIIVAILHK